MFINIYIIHQPISIKHEPSHHHQNIVYIRSFRIFTTDKVKYKASQNF